jgi:hypothetical protein
LLRSLRVTVGVPVRRQLSEIVIEGTILLRHENDVIDRLNSIVGGGPLAQSLTPGQ